MRLRRLHLPILALAAMFPAGCDLALDPSDNLEGYYDYAGTVYDAPGFSVNGQMEIDDAYDSGFGGDAEVDLDWYFYEGGRRILRIESLNPVPVDVRSDGRFYFEMEGRLQLENGQLTDFRLTHEGRRDGRTLRGTWRLQTELPSDDSGTFSARR